MTTIVITMQPKPSKFLLLQKKLKKTKKKKNKHQMNGIIEPTRYQYLILTVRNMRYRSSKRFL